MECTEEYIESAIKPIRTLLSDQKCIFEGFDSNTKWNLVISVVMLFFFPSFSAVKSFENLFGTESWKLYFKINFSRPT